MIGDQIEFSSVNVWFVNNYRKREGGKFLENSVFLFESKFVKT